MELRISADVCDLDSGEMLKYCKYFSEHSRYGQGLRDAIPTVKDQVVDCLFTDETLKQQAPVSYTHLLGSQYGLRCYFYQSAAAAGIIAKCLRSCFGRYPLHGSG